jgi:hypothetical protein
MTNAPYFDFDEEAFDAAADDGEVRAMAHRQFGISLVVALALLATAGLIAMNSPHGAPFEMTARHQISRPQAPQFELAQPTSPLAAPRG